jgi:hypothetical protein
MCPVCLASAGVVVAGVVSTGGVTALVAKILYKSKTNSAKNDSTEKEK